MLKVNAVVKITGLSKRTLQYYDEIGLIRPRRNMLNYRLYSDEDLEQLWQIQVYKEVGLRLNEIKLLLKVYDEEQRKQFLEKKLKEIEEAIGNLERKFCFVEKIKDNGIPSRRSVKSKNGNLTYQRLAKILVESVD